MTPTWYDLLGVEPDATPDQIKAAWRAATDSLEPGAGGSRFRLFNEAADVLLDPEKRRAYDASLVDAVEAAPAVSPAPAPVVEAAEPPPPPPPAAVVEPSPVVEPAETSEGRRTAAMLAALTSTLGLAILAVLTTAALVLAVVLAVDEFGGPDSDSSVTSFDPADGTAASSVAERAVAAVLGYDYRRLEADRDRALTFLTPEYQKTYEKIFDGLINGTEQAPGGAIKTKAVVTSTVRSTAVVDADEDTVRVLVFVDQQPTTNGKQQPVLANRVVATMVRSDGTWLLDNLDPLSAGF